MGIWFNQKIILMKIEKAKKITNKAVMALKKNLYTIFLDNTLCDIIATPLPHDSRKRILFVYFRAQIYEDLLVAVSSNEETRATSAVTTSCLRPH